MSRIYDSILDTIGNTPVVRINNLGPDHVNLFVKVESFNPMGSIKDRVALGLIEDAERKGELKPGQTIIEATSGNTGIGLAMVCAQKGYPLVITMAENFSVERRKLIRFLGAKVILTPASEKGIGMIRKAEELAEKHGWWQPRQFENPANADVHANTTAVEILDAFKTRTLDYWISGFGTGGTMNGVSRVLRQQSADTKIMICEPDNSQILGGKRAQPKNADGSTRASHPDFRPHLMQGWSPDFIPAPVEEAACLQYYDETVPVSGEVSLQCARDLAREEGILVGISGGATFAGALNVAETAPEGANILCMLPDTGERYLTTLLFDNVSAEMNEDEEAISKSTEGFRFDTSAQTENAKCEEIVVDENAARDVDLEIGDEQNPVVMFSLEWCEFCWSARKVFKEYGISYKAINLDSVKYQGGNMGTRMREALHKKTSWNTFPQIFINDEFIGGCTDLFDGLGDGSLVSKLEAAGIQPASDNNIDPYSLLPGWLHPRL